MNYKIDDVRVSFKISKPVSQKIMGQLIMDLNDSYPEKVSLNNGFILTNKEQKQGIFITNNHVELDFNCWNGPCSEETFQKNLEALFNNGIIENEVSGLRFTTKYLLNKNDNTISFVNAVSFFVEKENDAVLRTINFDKTVNDDVHNLAHSLRKDKKEARVVINYYISKKVLHKQITEKLKGKLLWAENYLNGINVFE
jgi:hypothetical protein